MAIIFINRGPSLFKCKNVLSKIWNNVKKIPLTSLTSESFDLESEQICLMQRKTKSEEFKVTARSSNGQVDS